jgi:hypothetical protein
MFSSPTGLQGHIVVITSRGRHHIKNESEIMDTGTQANPASPSSSKAIFQHVVTPVGELEQDPISFPFPKHTETRVFENLSSLVDPHNERSDGLYFVSGEAPGVEETNEGGAETK